MKTLRKYLKEIHDLTLKIEEEYPELYQHLDEEPLTIPNDPHPHVEKEELKKYLESLKGLLEHHIESHQKDQT